jgi:hypothetical protein
VFFDIEIGAESPVINQLDIYEGAASTEYKVHSGMVVKGERHMFLVDENDAYAIDMVTKEVTKLPGMHYYNSIIIFFRSIYHWTLFF